MRWSAGKSLLATLLVALTLCVGVAGQAGADAIDRARIVGLSGSERLRLFVLGRAVETGRAPREMTRALRDALERTAFYHEGGPAILDRSFRVSPVLAWDENINGGYFNGTLDIFGYLFEVNPQNMARAGLVAGLRADASLRLAWDEGRYLDLAAGAEAGWSPQHDIGRGNATLRACARNHTGGWTFADLCATYSAGQRALSESESTTLAFTVSRIVGREHSAHEFSVGIEHRWQEIGAQPGVALGWTAVWDNLTTEVNLGLSAPVDYEHATRLRLSARASWIWHNRPVTASVWHMQASGGMLLGMPREDNLTGVALSVQVRPGLSLDLSHQVTRSTIDLFDEARTGLGVRFQL